MIVYRKNYVFTFKIEICIYNFDLLTFLMSPFISDFIPLEPITFFDAQTLQSVKEGDDAIIKCTVGGDPEPSISWNYNGQPINGKNFMTRKSIFTSEKSIHNIE